MNKKILFLGVICSLIGFHNNGMNYVAKSMMKELPPLVTGKSFAKHVITNPKTYGFLVNWITSFSQIPFFSNNEKNYTKYLEKNITKAELTQDALDLLYDLDIDPKLIYTIDKNDFYVAARITKKYGPCIIIDPKFDEKLNKGDISIGEVLKHEKNHLMYNDFKRWDFFQPILHTSGVILAHKLFKPITLLKKTLTKTNTLSSPGKIKIFFLYPWEAIKGITCGLTKSVFGEQFFNIYMRKREQAADDNVYHPDPQKLDLILKGAEDLFSEIFTNTRQHQVKHFPKIIQPIAEYLIDPYHPKLEKRIAKIKARRQKLREEHPNLFSEEDLRIKN